jgi:hypothetical protein
MGTNKNTLVPFDRRDGHFLEGVEFEGVCSDRGISELVRFKGSVFPICSRKYRRMTILQS